MQNQQTPSSAINRGLDRKNLKVINKRFMLVNQARLARTRLALSRQQQYYLDLLPLFFHVNHPIMPGFVSRKTPKGVANYQPSKVEIQKAQRIARSFTYHRDPNPHCLIEGLYLMGSCGTIAQSGVSDLDIWLCHPSGLSPDELAELQKKCTLLERYADTLALEVHFFLMDAEQFRQGQRASLSTEDCGSSQHFLLLDEFYRTGLLIAGKPPIWWLIPPTEEINYQHFADTLRDKRYLNKDHIVDFGGIPEIPAGEFIGAGIWQLYKGVSSPYKSALKLLIIEVYASEYPKVENLGILFKRAIYNERLDIDELDPYVMIYRKLEHYLLSRHELKRLELIRRCFYIKVGKKLSKPPSGRKASWQRLLTQKLVSEWGWDQAMLSHLDNQANWKVLQVIEERKELVRELMSSYRFLVEFARKHQTSAHISAQEMAILGRKLYAAFERRAGKVERINPGITSDLSEEIITFSYQQRHDQWGWSIYAEQHIQGVAPRTPALKRSQHLMELMSWCHINGIITQGTRIDFIRGEHQLDELELPRIQQSLLQHLSPALQQHDEDNQAFTRAAHAELKLLFINVGIDPMQAVKEKGMQRLSSQTDSLGYSGLKENLVISIDEVNVNSWHEVSTVRYEGTDALLHCIRQHLESCPPDGKQQPAQLKVFCHCASRAQAIASRVEELFRDIERCFYSASRSSQSRYVVQIESNYCVIQYLGKQQVRIHKARSQAALLHYLGEAQNQFSHLILDRYTLQQSVLNAIAQINTPNTVQVFFHAVSEKPPKQGATAYVYLADEQGSIYHYHTPYFNDQTLLNPLAQFLQSSQYRQSNASFDSLLSDAMLFGGDLLSPNASPMLFYDLVPSSGLGPTLIRQREINLQLDSAHYFNVQAIAERDQNERIVFNIYCDQQEFSALEFGDDLYCQAARFILARRQNGERYPCYITDLDLTRALHHESHKTIQTVQYMRYKQLLEKRINDALQRL
jgi:adenylate cyclase class 1